MQCHTPRALVVDMDTPPRSSLQVPPEAKINVLVRMIEADSQSSTRMQTQVTSPWPQPGVRGEPIRNPFALNSTSAINPSPFAAPKRPRETGKGFHNLVPRLKDLISSLPASSAVYGQGSSP